MARLFASKRHTRGPILVLVVLGCAGAASCQAMVATDATMNAEAESFASTAENIVPAAADGNQSGSADSNTGLPTTSAAEPNETAATAAGAANTTTTTTAPNAAPAASYTQAMCLADLEKDMAYAGDRTNMTAAQKTETAAAVLSAAARHYPELPLKTVAQIMIANMRQESDFAPSNVSGERDGSGDAYGLLQVSPFGNSQELTLFVRHADVTGLIDYRTNAALDVSKLTANDLKDPWINIHVATWIQANLARSGSADPTDWGTKQGPKAACYLTGLGSWVAGPAADDDSGYGRSGDDISADYFRGILHDLNYISGQTNTTSTLAALQVEAKPIRFRR